MNKSESEQSTTPETEVGKTEELETQPKQTILSIVQGILDDKRAVDSAIHSKTKEVQQIFSLSERPTEDESEFLKESVVNNPEEILQKGIKTVSPIYSKIENQTIEEIVKVLITTGLQAREVQSWLAANREEIQSLILKKESLEVRTNKLSAQLSEEKQKNFFVKLFRKKKRQEISSQLMEASIQIPDINFLSRSRQSYVDSIERNMQEFSIDRQEFAINAIEPLFRSVKEKYQQLKEKLITPEVKKELNEDLIAKRVLPALEKLQTKGRITKKDAEEYIGLLKLQLTEGCSPRWNGPVSEKEVINTRNKRIDELDKKSGYTLKNVGSRVSSETNETPDSFYDNIFDLLLHEQAKEKIEQISDLLGSSLSSELQQKIAEIAEDVIFRYPGGEGNILDLNRVPIDYFDKLKGLERWQIVKDFAETSGIMPAEVFKRIEKIIIERSFNEQLLPGGSESGPGTLAAGRMGELGNPEALPLMLRYIEVYGSGHTSDGVVYQMEGLLKGSNPEKLQETLEALPRKKKILLETLTDENSYMSRFGRSNSRYITCSLLQYGDRTLIKERLTKILEEGGEFDKSKLEDFYLSETEDTAETLEPLLKARTEVEQVIIDSKSNIWSQSADKLLAALVNPRNGEPVEFPKKIIQQGLGISDEKMLGIVDQIFATKTFKRSGFDREAFLDGFVLLNSRENGKAVLETLLNAYRGAKEDPTRIRRVLQHLSTLDSFGEYDFATPGQDKVAGINKEIVTLQKQYSETKNATEKKGFKNRIETLNVDLQNLTGLKGIEELMTKRVVEAACKRLDLPQGYKEKIEKNLDELLKNGIFEIVPSLAGNYEAKNEPEVRNLLRTITMHIIEGDFKSWRYSHEQSGTQLADLTEEQKGFWKETLEPVNIEINLSEDERGRRADELRTAQEIVRNAKEHILDSQPEFDFSKERMQLLTEKTRELTEMIKSSTFEDEKKRLGLEKTKVHTELTLVKGILDIENATIKSFTREKMLIQARELRRRITELNLPLAGLDIEQIEKIFTVGDIKSIRASESDDPITLFKVGVEPQETCQSWRRGGFNECLLSYVADSNKKVINVADGEGQIILRSIIKLTDQKEIDDFESKTKRKTLLVEKHYSLLSNPEVYRSFIRLILIKAQGLDASITLGETFTEDIMEIFKEEASAFGYETKEDTLDIFIPHSLNKYEYSDTLGGKINWFGRYQQLKVSTLEKVKT